MQAVATPGHTPDHHAYVLHRSGRPVAVFSGGSLMVGTVGRTDLCGTERTEPLARQMFHSLRRYDELPDDVAVYPTHGAGSFCSAPGAAERTTTLGRERVSNPLFSVTDEDEFVARLLAGFGTFPTYFARLPELNRLGPRRYDALPRLDRLSADDVEGHLAAGGVVVDVRPVAAFAAGHLPGSMANTLRPPFASWLGWLVDPDRPLVFVLDDDQDRDELVRQCLDIGHEHLVGELTGGIDAWRASGRPLATIAMVEPAAMHSRVVDVRQANEYAAGHVPGARHVELGAIPTTQLPGRTVHRHVRPRRAGHDRRQPPHRPRPPGQRARRRPRHLGGRHRPPPRHRSMTTRVTDAPIRLGLRENLAQFSLLVAVNALVGGMIGQERTVLPLLADEVFGLTAFTAALTFIVAFGIVKAATNFFAGTLSDRYGRKPVLVAGWIIGLPVPLLLMWAPSWGWVVFANVLLGVNQGLTWSTTVIMKIDLVGPARRGFAMGLNEAAGYGAVALTALATGYIAQQYGLRPEPFLLGVAYAALGLGLSTFFVRETRGHARFEAAHHPTERRHEVGLSTKQVFTLTSFRDRALSSCSQAGLVNNLNDGLAWGLFPLYFADAGLSVGRIGVLAALYPAVWGLGQLYTGGLSDRIGRKPLIVGGMLAQAAAIAWIAATTGFAAWAVGALVLGAGTAMVYPTLLAAVGDVAHPAWRARSVGVYRLWRDAGFAVGALLAGILADLFSITAAIWAVAALTALSGLVVATRMYETHRPTT